MFNFSKISSVRVDQCHIDLQILFKEVIKHYDCSALCGHRNEEEQNMLFNMKPQRSKVQYPNSKHNKNPSIAIDVVPYPVSYSKNPKNIARYYNFAGFVEGIAIQLLARGYIKHKIGWGGDWDNDRDFNDQTFDDLAHFWLRPIE